MAEREQFIKRETGRRRPVIEDTAMERLFESEWDELVVIYDPGSGEFTVMPVRLTESEGGDR
jgi:hypothetical protein